MNAFKDRNSIEQWLRVQQKPHAAVALAVRAALRAIPGLTDYYQPPPADDFIANLILHALASAASAWVPTTTGSELISLYRAAQADRASWDQLTSRFEKGHPKVTVGDDWMRMRHLARLGASKAAFSSAASAGLCHVSSLIDISHSARPLEGYAAEAMIDGCDSNGFLGDLFGSRIRFTRQATPIKPPPLPAMLLLRMPPFWTATEGHRRLCSIKPYGLMVSRSWCVGCGSI